MCLMSSLLFEKWDPYRHFQRHIPSPPSPPPLPNLLDNPGFEDGTSGWTGYHCSLSHDESSVGKNSIRVNNRLNRIADQYRKFPNCFRSRGCHLTFMREYARK